MDPEIQRKINQAKIDMMDENSGSIFFSSLLTQLKIIIDPTMETAWTDAIHIGLSPDLVIRATVEELIGTFMHELGHVIYDHVDIAMENKEWMDHDKHNVAGDHYINLDLKKNRYVLPHWITPYCDAKYTGWSSMKIYDDLVKNPPPPMPAGSTGMGNDVRMPANMSASEHKERVISAVVKATMQASMFGEKGIGSIPGHIKRIVEEVTSPKLPWHMILQNFMSSRNNEDYSMARPNRRYMPEHYLPSLISEGMGPMLVADDVSGSISREELNIAGCETKYAFDILKPESLRYISFDTKIHFNEVFQRDDDIPSNLELHGGGGTDLNPVFEYLRTEDYKLALIFTDGGFHMPNMDGVDTEIFWIIKGCPSFNPPKGIVIHME